MTDIENASKALHWLVKSPYKSFNEALSALDKNLDSWFVYYKVCYPEAFDK